ncbi:MAG: ABC transporter ATP-binding protein [Patescibacteria group bacterium]|nr:ABC transporter ATP-binding protein [Patescibacteria group bacterium]
MQQEQTSAFSIFETLWDLVRPYRSRSMKIIFWVIVNKVTDLAEPTVWMLLVDHLVKQQQSAQPNKLYFAAMCAAALLAYSIGPQIAHFKNRATFEITHEIGLNIKTACLKSLLNSPIFRFQTDSSGKLMGTLHRGVGRTVETIWVTAFETIPLIVTTVIVTITLLVARYQAALALAPFVIISLLILRWNKRRITPLRKTAEDLSENVDSKTSEVLGNVLTVQAFNQENEETRKLVLLNAERSSTDKKVDLMYSKGWLISSFTLVALGRVAVVAVCGLAVLSHEMTIGQLIFVASVTGQVFNTVQGFGRIYERLIRAEESIKRTLKLMRGTDNEVDEPSQCEFPQPKGFIEFHDVSYKYPDTKSYNPNPSKRVAKDALRDVSFAIEPGMLVGVVGQSGSGKTTLLNLIMGFDCPTDGAVTLDDIDLRAIAPSAVREHIGYVPCVIQLRNMSVAKNIAYGKPDATQYEIEDAAKQAGAHEFIKALPQGYDTIIGNHGSKLSAGQQQRICLARALILKPAILALDEPTMHLDTENSWNIVQTINDLRGKCTIILVTHELWQVQNADLILVIHEGKLAEQGNHRRLMSKRGYYHVMQSRNSVLRAAINSSSLAN